MKKVSIIVLISSLAFASHAKIERTNIAPLPRTTVLGILGGGQLGRMLALAASNLGIKVMVLDPGERPPAAVASQAVKGHFRNAANIQEFASKVGVLTVEIEHVDTTALSALEDSGAADVQPSAHTIAVIQDKFAQKQHFKSKGVALGEFCEIADEAALVRAASQYGYPLILKSKRLAYDGKGNFVVHSPEDHAAAVAKLGGFDRGLYAEKWQKFSKELAVMVVRSRNGAVKLYPVTETVQKDNICHVTETPALVSKATRIAAEKLAMQAVSSLQGAGIFGVEMFLMNDNKVLLNEVAPRVHNSGHYTIDGAVTSQFENHVRAMLGWPLGDTSLTSNHVIMLNILGEDDGVKGEKIASDLIDRALNTPGCSVHWYDKSDVSKGRKVGHINIVGKTVQEARARLAMLDPSAVASLAK